MQSPWPSSEFYNFVTLEGHPWCTIGVVAAMKNLAISRILPLLLALSSLASAQHEIGFLEKFALAPDRDAVLKELVAGTEEYYFFHALQHQLLGRRIELDTILTQWAERFPASSLREEILQRQALLDYDREPEKTLEYLRAKLNLTLSHQQQKRDPRPNLPSRLDPPAISPAAFRDAAFAGNDNLGGIQEEGIDWLMRNGPETMSVARQRELLSRLKRPDYPNLVGLILADLKRADGKAFGDFEIHRLLLPEQLAELRQERPQLMERTNFVHAWLSKLAPSADEDLNRDPAARERWLDRTWEFAKDLLPKFNSLKAHLLYQRLQHDLRTAGGKLDGARFLAYVKLPRRCNYVNPKWEERDEAAWKFPADLQAGFENLTHAPPVANDQQLVRTYLLHFLAQAKDASAYSPYLEDAWLNSVLAEAKLTAGVGNAEEWFSLLIPAQVQALKDRVELDFVPWHRSILKPEDEVSLTVDVKNVPKLLVRVFAVSAENYYRENQRQISTDLNLDGLTAGEEQTFDYAAPPMLRHRETFKFPKLNQRGVWIVEFIGGRKSSRAVIRKGGLLPLTRRSSAGTVLTVFDEEGKSLPKAYAVLGSQRFDAGAGGEILIPFSAKTGPQLVVLGDGAGFAALESVDLQGENYTLAAGFHVEREALLAGQDALVTVRPALLINGASAGLDLLQDVKLTLQATNLSGVPAVTTISPFKLEQDKEVAQLFHVPDRLAVIRAELSATVKSVVTGQPISLTAAQEFKLNEINRSAQVTDLHLANVGGVWLVNELGRTGEPAQERGVRFWFWRSEFSAPRDLSLKTDNTGTVLLGPLEGVVRLQAQTSGGLQRSWTLPRTRFDGPANLHGRTGEEIAIPLANWSAEKARPESFSLLAMREGTFVGDALSKALIQGGFLRLKGLEPGDYSLLLRDSNRSLTLRVTSGTPVGGYLVEGKSRLLERTPNAPLQVLAALPKDSEKLRVRLLNATPQTRLHVFASRYAPEFDAFTALGHAHFPEPLFGQPAWLPNLFLSGRDIGDEYRYVLERRFQPKHAGVMLPRPGLILNPWALGATDTANEVAQRGEELEGLAAGVPAATSAFGAEAKQAAKVAAEPAESADLNFLASPAAVLLNLTPDAEGFVEVDVAKLNDRQFVRLVAVDGLSGVSRDVVLPERALKLRDLRLNLGLEPQGHFTEQSKSTLMEAGHPHAIEDAVTAQFHVIGDLGAVHRYFSGLTHNAELAEFAWILNWPKLTAEKKRELYSKYACHELSFFLSRKDRAFFEAVIKPYLANKRDQTFLDHYLLEADLADYLRPWNYGRLNVAERILLGTRLPGRMEMTRRHVAELLSLAPIKPENAVMWSDAGLLMEDFVATASENAPSHEERERGRTDAIREVKLLKSLKAEESASFAGKFTPVPDLAVKEQLKRGFSGGAKVRFAAGTVVLGDADGEAVLEAGDVVVPGVGGSSNGYFGYTGAWTLRSDANLRQQQRRFFRKPDPTQEWAENNYWHLLIAQQDASLISASRFWQDYAEWDGKSSFVSPHLADAARNFSEMMLAMALLDLPFPAESGDLKSALDGTRLTLTAKNRSVLFHREIKPAVLDEGAAKLLVSQGFFRQNDRYLEKDGEKSDKLVTEEFLTGIVYGCQVVVTNASSSRQKLDVLFQIPRGAIPVLGAKATQTVPVTLEAFHSQTLDFHFYFPQAGQFIHYPVHVSKAEKVVAAATPFSFKVVDQLSKMDTQSWSYVSQWGSAQEVLAFLKEANLLQTDLDMLAWRLRDVDFYRQTLALLEERHVFHPAAYAYALLHNDLPRMQEFLLHAREFLQGCGPALESKLVTVDPVAQGSYQHLEYSPLINARAHLLGSQRTILNDRFREQYQQLLNVLAHQAKLSEEDQLAVCYYLVLQDRLTEAAAILARLKPEKVREQMQYDYLKGWLAMCQEDAATARQIVDRYAAHPVDKWREKFREMAGHLDELEGAKRGPRTSPDKDLGREQEQEGLAIQEPLLSLTVEAAEAVIHCLNVQEVAVRYYPVDLEFLFSTNPFVSSDTGRFRMVQPTKLEILKLPAGATSHRFSLPKEFQDRNVVVEVSAAGKSAAQASYANQLEVQVSESYGRLQVRHAADHRPLSKVYVKVFAEINGQPRFYKDGYTDLRGKFDYLSLSTEEINRATRFSILVLSDEFGAEVKEVMPPRQ